jgi:hypothetical protein
MSVNSGRLSVPRKRKDSGRSASGWSGRSAIGTVSAGISSSGRTPHPVGQHRQVALTGLVGHAWDRRSVQFDLAAAADPFGGNDHTHLVVRRRGGKQPCDQLPVAGYAHWPRRPGADHDLVVLLWKHGQTQPPLAGKPAERYPAGQRIFGPGQRSLALVDPVTNKRLVAIQAQVDESLRRTGVFGCVRGADRQRIALGNIGASDRHSGYRHRQLPGVAPVGRRGVGRRADAVDLDQLPFADRVGGQHERVQCRIVAATVECHLPTVAQRQFNSARKAGRELDPVVAPREHGQPHRPTVAEPAHRVFAVERHRRLGVRPLARIDPRADEQFVFRRTDVQNVHRRGASLLSRPTPGRPDCQHDRSGDKPPQRPVIAEPLVTPHFQPPLLEKRDRSPVSTTKRRDRWCLECTAPFRFAKR